MKNFYSLIRNIHQGTHAFRPITFRPIRYVTFISSHAHFVTFTSSPLILSQIHFVLGSVCPIHFVPWFFCPKLILSHTFRPLTFRPLTFRPKFILSHTMHLSTVCISTSLIWSANFNEPQKEKKKKHSHWNLFYNVVLFPLLFNQVLLFLRLMDDIEVLNSKRGNPIVYHDGYVYTQHRVTDEKRVFRCESRDCKSKY